MVDSWLPSVSVKGGPVVSGNCMEASRVERAHALAGGTVYMVAESVGIDTGADNIRAVGVDGPDRRHFGVPVEEVDKGVCVCRVVVGILSIRSLGCRAPGAPLANHIVHGGGVWWYLS